LMLALRLLGFSRKLLKRLCGLAGQVACSPGSLCGVSIQ
jgi:hypothetical protein